MKTFKFILIITLSIAKSGLCQSRSDFVRQLEFYFKNHKVDSIEGLYTISDDIVVITPWYSFSPNRHIVRDHWAKVALIRDSTSLTRDYYEKVLEAPNLKEAEVRAEFLRTKQNATLFISKQLSYDGDKIYTMMFEFLDEEMLISKFEYQDGDNVIKLKRTYLKYYPKK